ncbi:glutathione S-transferase 1-like [Antedon mediterranea]|uniref:glutathione S-transferase 1-like n=1 Tax=Antedon mediterranea TaxID=105859 RepID=UPI003AF4CE07
MFSAHPFLYATSLQSYSSLIVPSLEMPSYKLYYFAARGVGETSRLLFAAAEKEYEDFRIVPPQWPTLKPKMPFGQLPVLEVDGEQIPQSRAVENYLAREFGLYGSNKQEKATIDVVCEVARELKMHLSLIFYAKEDPKERQRLVGELKDKIAPTIMTNLTKYLNKNTEGHGWFVGNSISYADIVVYAHVEKIVDNIGEDAFKDYPALKANFKRVASNKGIANWLENRPVTPFVYLNIIMSEYTLVYFNGRGRAETARILFEVAGVKYVDKRIPRENWPAMKADTPLGKLPYLEAKGMKLPQSSAINRFLANEFGMFGKDKIEKATIDAITECLRDLEGPIIKFFYEKDETKKVELKKELCDEKIPLILKAIEKQLCKNNEGNGWFVGESISLADIDFFCFMDWLVFVNPDVLTDFHKLKGLYDRIKTHEQISKWLAKRPETEF